MIEEKSVLGVILARGGSKGLPRKNVRKLGGKPMIAWTIEAGQKSQYLDRLILSSDDEKIIEVASTYGCDAPFRRPTELAQDDTPTMDALLHAVDQVGLYDYVVLLQPTSPLRTHQHVDATITRCHRKDAPACATVKETDKPPQWMYTLRDDHILEPVLKSKQEITRRQDAPSTYAFNGAVYVAITEWLKKEKTFKSSDTIAYVMSKESSVDVDDKIDLIVAEALIKEVK